MKVSKEACNYKFISKKWDNLSKYEFTLINNRLTVIKKEVSFKLLHLFSLFFLSPIYFNKDLMIISIISVALINIILHCFDKEHQNLRDRRQTVFDKDTKLIYFKFQKIEIPFANIEEILFLNGATDKFFTDPGAEIQLITKGNSYLISSEMSGSLYKGLEEKIIQFLNENFKIVVVDEPGLAFS